MSPQRVSLAASEDSWMTKAILDASRTPFYRLSPNGQILYVNKAACESLGYSNEELIGMYPWEFDPDFKPEDWPSVWDNLKKHEIVHIETRHRRKDGTILDVEVTGHYISHGSEEFNFTFVQDVTARKAAENALKTQQTYLRALIDNFPFMVWLKDRDSRLLAVNQVYARYFGHENPADVLGKTDYDLSPFDLAEHYRKDDLKIMENRTREIIEEEQEGTHGRNWIETFKAPVISEDGELLGTVGFARDITDRKNAEAELKLTARAFESQEAMVVTDNNSRILRVNDAFCRVTGYEPSEVIGNRMSILSSGIHPIDFYNNMWRNILEYGGWQGEVWNRRKGGEIYPQWLSITAIKGGDGEVLNYVGTMMDITLRKEAEEHINHLAHYDLLTDLPNRALLMDRLKLAIAHSRRDHLLLGFMYVDLDRFKEVNDTLGHGVGDLLLKEVAKRLLACVKRETDTVARIGGDEFVVLLPQVERLENVLDIAQKILMAMNTVFWLDSNPVKISSSIGIAQYPTHADSIEKLIKTADDALYEAKAAGRNCIKISPLVSYPLPAAGP